MSEEKSDLPLSPAEAIEQARLEMFGNMAMQFVAISGVKGQDGAPAPGFVAGERRRVLDALEVLFMPPAKSPIESIVDMITPHVMTALVTALANKEVRDGLLETLDAVAQRMSGVGPARVAHVPETPVEASVMTDASIETALAILLHEKLSRANVTVSTPPAPSVPDAP